MGRYDEAQATKDGLFELGEVMVSKDAAQILERERMPAQSIIDNHACGDWGDVSTKIWTENDFAVGNGNRRVLSYLIVPNCEGIVIITARDRSETVVMAIDEFCLPESALV
jgi:hypothetical protein